MISTLSIVEAHVELREFMSVRRAYNLVRQETEGPERLTFEEFAILCRLSLATRPMKTSEIADYQGALRPTMTHRANHLAELGYIERDEGTHDRRNIVCSISAEGRARAMDLAKKTCAKIATGQPLARTVPSRMCKYVDAMGSVYCTAGELVQLSLHGEDAEGGCTVTSLVAKLGLLQPTVSMSVATLVRKEYVERKRVDGMSVRSNTIALTPRGREVTRPLAERIEGLVVRRGSRTS